MAQQEAKLPEGWTEHVDPASGNTYYCHTATGNTSWDKPLPPERRALKKTLTFAEKNAPLPEGWVEHIDPASGNPYYIHTESGVSTWEKPLPPQGKALKRSMTIAQREAPLPEGWVESVDAATGKTYYSHAETGKSTWDKPLPPERKALKRTMTMAQQEAALPEGWTEMTDPASGGLYYYHADKGLTTWEKPVPPERKALQRSMTMAEKAYPLPAGWVENVDPASGKKYYSHAETGASTWEKPLPPEGKALKRQMTVAQMEAPLAEGWVENVDPSSGATYYSNAETGVSTWEKPVAAMRRSPSVTHGELTHGAAAKRGSDPTEKATDDVAEKRGSTGSAKATEDVAEKRGSDAALVENASGSDKGSNPSDTVIRFESEEEGPLGTSAPAAVARASRASKVSSQGSGSRGSRDSQSAAAATADQNSPDAVSVPKRKKKAVADPSLAAAAIDANTWEIPASETASSRGSKDDPAIPKRKKKVSGESTVAEVAAVGEETAGIAAAPRTSVQDPAQEIAPTQVPKRKKKVSTVPTPDSPDSGLEAAGVVETSADSPQAHAGEEMSGAAPTEVPKRKKKVSGASSSASDAQGAVLEAAGVIETSTETPQGQADGEMPEGWSQHEDPDTGKVYFHNALTGASAWERPLKGEEPMPDGWAEYTDPSSGNKYYSHLETGEVVWDRPTR